MGVSMGLHYSNFSTSQTLNPLRVLSALTKYSELSLSTPYSEKAFNPTYPEMPTLKKMDFIYE
jgi:hypothetical protein